MKPSLKPALNYVFLLLIASESSDCFSIISRSKSVRKRSLIYPIGSSFMQMVVGVGLPFEINKQSITTGPFMKSYYLFPTNVSHWTNPSIDIDQEPIDDTEPADDEEERRKKREATKTRWSLYSTLSAAAEFLGYGGKACILRAICEASETPFTEMGGIFAEIVHVILTPSSSEEPNDNYLDNDYHAAEQLGKTKKNCKSLFPECKNNLMEEYTNIISHL